MITINGYTEDRKTMERDFYAPRFIRHVHVTRDFYTYVVVL